MVLHLTFVILAEINTAGIRKVLHIAMGSGDKPPSRLLGPKSGAIRGKAVVEQSVVLENESELQESIMDCDWSQLESTYIRMMDRHERSEEELRDHITKLLQVPYNEYSTYPPGFDMTLQVFTAWSQTTVEHDETRALKRSVISRKTEHITLSIFIGSGRRCTMSRIPKRPWRKSGSIVCRN